MFVIYIFLKFENNYIVKYGNVVYLRKSLAKLSSNFATIIINVRKINYFVISIISGNLRFCIYRFKKFKCLGKIKLNTRISTSIQNMIIFKYSSDLK